MRIKTFVWLILIIAVLSHPDATFQYAYEGLYQWAVKMVPTLFPFMMISSIMVYSGADLELGRMLSIPLKRVYRYSTYGLYAIFMGFFCGFPMGAKVVSELCEHKKLSKEEAVSLLGFCNNIGPAYFHTDFTRLRVSEHAALPIWHVWYPGNIRYLFKPPLCQSPSPVRQSGKLAGTGAIRQCAPNAFPDRLSQKGMCGEHAVPDFAWRIHHLYKRLSHFS